jgi:signal recognition particle subunit SRP54
MVFEGFSEKIQNIMKKIRGKTRITEDDIKEISREIKLALLEADVNFKVVKDFIAKISEKAMGQDVLKSLTPGQQVVKIVHQELISLLGETSGKLTFNSNDITVFLMVGLQGSGKTTASGKIANFLRKQGKNPLLIACDVYRPAAVKQLEVIGSQLNIPVFSIPESKDVVHIAKEGVKFARAKGNNVVIVDTAGRLHVDEELMQELVNLKAAVKPYEILLVVDAMTGQDAVNVATSFNEKLGIDGIIMTKLDGDTRGGAALSVKAVTGKPIKFAGTGEKLSDLEPFYPDRMASRILGMGDVLSLIEKAEESFEEDEARKLEKKLRDASFTLEDFLSQMQQIKKMGPLSQVLGMLPGVGAQLKNVSIDDKQINHVEAIVLSMTKKERNHPEIINASRKKRIAAGSGMQIQDVNKLLKQFEEMKKMMKNFSKNKYKMPF